MLTGLAQVADAITQPAGLANTIVLAIAAWGAKRFVTQVEKLTERLDASVKYNHRMHQETIARLNKVNEDVIILKYKAGISTSFNPTSDADSR